jgi:hypothetical protein
MVGIRVNCPLFFPSLTEVGMCRLFKSPKYTKIYPVGVAVFSADTQTSDEAKSQFLQLFFTLAL